jgi:hypothetical protein
MWALLEASSWPLTTDGKGSIGELFGVDQVLLMALPCLDETYSRFKDRMWQGVGELCFRMTTASRVTMSAGCAYPEPKIAA